MSAVSANKGDDDGSTSCQTSDGKLPWEASLSLEDGGGGGQLPSRSGSFLQSVRREIIPHNTT